MTEFKRRDRPASQADGRPGLLAPSHYYALATVLLWSSAYVFTKMALKHFTFASLGFLRCAVAAVVLAMALAVKKAPRPKAADLPWFMLSGATGFALYLLAFNRGSAWLNPTTSCLVISTAPLITALLASHWFGEGLTAAGWGALMSAFGGVALLMLGEGEVTFTWGVFWMLLAALLISLYNIIQRKLAAGRDSLTITAYSFFAATILLAWGAAEAIEECRQASLGDLAVAVYLGVFPSALAYLLWVKALALASRTSAVANHMYLTPLLALILEYLILAETPGVGTFLGGAVILGSLVLFNRKGRRPPQP
jgi:drug/metabolite transporter (DMT)-like permease